MSPPVLQRRDGAVLHLTLHRPEVLNALNRALMDALRRELAAAAHDNDIRAIILTGAGRSFCAGADLLEEPEGAPVSMSQGISDGMTSHFNPLVRDIADFPKPTIAAVNGVAAGGGVGLALACDITIAARSATFIQVFAPKLGLVPDMGCSWQLSNRVGVARAKGLSLLGDKLCAEDAERWGLIWQCVPDDEIMTRATAIAAKLAEGPTKAFIATRQALTEALKNDFAAQLDLERRLQFAMGQTADHQEGLMAFAQKRAPQFRGE